MSTVEEVEVEAAMREKGWAIVGGRDQCPACKRKAVSPDLA
ncbi:MAG TPA: hypothetical protein VJS64_08090 [Pyrinomonadaceae bacterium]|nr:hypothetical protein [Pyrinomonadaceae bacterium]